MSILGWFIVSLITYDLDIITNFTALPVIYILTRFRFILNLKNLFIFCRILST